MPFKKAMWIGLTAALGTATMSGGAGYPAKPDKFHDVPLAPGSKPHYACIAMDARSNDVAYLLFDGNPKDGYQRLYIWTPRNTQKYPKPAPLTLTEKEQNRYSPFSFSATDGGETVSMNWQMSWALHVPGGEHFDYYSGKVVSVPRNTAAAWPYFYFTLRFSRGPRSAASGGSWPLDLHIHGQIFTVTEWKELRPPQAPWYALNFRALPVPSYTKDRGALNFMGKLYHHNAECQIKSLPKESKLMLTVKPYMEEPVHAAEVSVTDVFGTGIKVDVPAGAWYNFDWEIDFPGLWISDWADYKVWPYPFPTKAAAGQ